MMLRLGAVALAVTSSGAIAVWAWANWHIGPAVGDALAAEAFATPLSRSARWALPGSLLAAALMISRRRTALVASAALLVATGGPLLYEIVRYGDVDRLNARLLSVSDDIVRDMPSLDVVTQQLGEGNFPVVLRTLTADPDKADAAQICSATRAALAQWAGHPPEQLRSGRPCTLRAERGGVIVLVMVTPQRSLAPLQGSMPVDLLPEPPAGEQGFLQLNVQMVT